MMTPEEAFDFLNGLFIKAGEPSLSTSEKAIFLGIWQGKTYQEISNIIGFSHEHTRGMGSSLFKKINDISNLDISKKNFNITIEYLWKQQAVNFPSSIQTFGELENLAEHEEFSHAHLSHSEVNLEKGKNANSNPFIPLNDRVESPQLFFGRDLKIRQVFDVLNTGSSVALIGEEGIGKSSLLLAICREAENRLLSPRNPFFIDLNKIYDEDDFYRALCSEIGIPESRGYFLERNLRERRVLLALDNVGKITRDGFTRQVRDQLRGLAEGNNAPLKLILAASEPLDDLFKDSQTDGKTSPLAGICLPEDIKPWDGDTIRALIKTRLDKTSVNFTEEEIIQLVQESGGNPKKLMQLCYRTYARHQEGMQ